MKKMSIFMLGLILTTALVMTAVGCDNESTNSSSTPTSPHEVLIGTWHSATSVTLDGGEVKRFRYTITSTNVSIEGILSTDNEATWISDPNDGKNTGQRVSSKTEGSVVTLTFKDGMELEFILINNDTFTALVGKQIMTFNRVK